MKNPRTKAEAIARRAEIKAKWYPRGQAAGEATNKAVLNASAAVIDVSYTGFIAVKGYVENVAKKA